MRKASIILLLAIMGLIAYYGLMIRKKIAGNVFPGPQAELLLLQTKGRIDVKNDNLVVLTRAGNEKGYILVGPLTKELVKFNNREFEVIGKVFPTSTIIVNSKPITAKIEVLAFGEKLIPTSNTSTISEALLEVFQQKIDNKILLREQIIKKLKKNDAFDLAKGRLTKEMREIPGKGGVEQLLLLTDDGDTFVLTGPALKLLQNKFTEISSKPVVIVGAETLPEKESFLKPGETTFNVLEAYTDSLAPIK